MKKSKRQKKPVKPRREQHVRTVPDFTTPSVQCPYVFPEHGTHASQQCIRVQGHVGAHHCGGVKK